MSDIFISYARDDRTKAKMLAESLQQRGWSVWWDRNIPPGKSFDQVIEEALAAARCVVGLWSKASVTSNWVKTEAAEGARRRILIPALIEDAIIPLEFRRIQTANLSDWNGNSPHLDFDEFLKAVATLLGSAVPQNGAGAAPVTFNWYDKRIKAAALIVVVVTLTTAVVALHQKWLNTPTPTGSGPPTEQVPVPTADSIRHQSLSWGPDHGKDPGACIDGCSTFLPWSELHQELERIVFPLTPNLPPDASARLASLGGEKDRVIQVTDRTGNVLANVWVGVNPAVDWKFDGLLRVGSASSPPKVWASFERLSNGNYRRR